MPPAPPIRHTCLHVREHAFMRYYHRATTMFPPPHLKILYETLSVLVFAAGGWEEVYNEMLVLPMNKVHLSSCTCISIIQNTIFLNSIKAKAL